MAQRLSQQQRQILGIAYHTNQLTSAEVKQGERDSCHGATMAYPGVADINWTLAAKVVHQLPMCGPDEHALVRGKMRFMGCTFSKHLTPELTQLKASIVRTLHSLHQRELLVFNPSDEGGRAGYLLTPQGYAIGAANEVVFSPLLLWRCMMICFESTSVGPANSWYWNILEQLERGQLGIDEVLTAAGRIEHNHQWRELARDWRQECAPAFRQSQTAQPLGSAVRRQADVFNARISGRVVNTGKQKDKEFDYGY